MYKVGNRNKGKVRSEKYSGRFLRCLWNDEPTWYFDHLGEAKLVRGTHVPPILGAQT